MIFFAEMWAHKPHTKRPDYGKMQHRNMLHSNSIDTNSQQNPVGNHLSTSFANLRKYTPSHNPALTSNQTNNYANRHTQSNQINQPDQQSQHNQLAHQQTSHHINQQQIFDNQLNSPVAYQSFDQNKNTPINGAGTPLSIENDAKLLNAHSERNIDNRPAWMAAKMPDNATSFINNQDESRDI